MQFRMPWLGTVFGVATLLSSCFGDAGTDSDQAFSDSDAPVAATTAALTEGSTGQLCIVQKVGGNPPCTANDVRIGSMMLVGDPMTCTPGETINVTIQADIVSGPDRYDIGLWVNESGGSAKDDPDGTCYRDYLPPPLSANACDQLGGPYFDGDADTCGDVYAQNTDPCGNKVQVDCMTGEPDVAGTCALTTRQFMVDIVCVDDDGNGIADAGTCTSWENMANAGDCTDELDTDPGTGAKCSCESIDITGLFFGCKVDGDCDDMVACTDDVCTIEGNVGTCSNTPNDGNCSDGMFCNGVETCDPVNDCQAGIAPDCDDMVECTDDSCNEMTDMCDNIANNGNCDNGLFCDGEETCDPENDCQQGTPVDCNDMVTCTIDSCNEMTDMCDNMADDGLCTDGNICTGIEFCDPVNDCQMGTPLICDDMLFCNGVEFCDPMAGCQSGMAPNCDDGVLCTNDSCNEITDMCVNMADDGNCSDGMFCNGVETCDPVNDCQAGMAPDCDDSVVCTDDSCNEDTDECDNDANDANCDNGLFCDGMEICDPTLDCQDGADPDCNDMVTCTVDSCDEDIDECVNAPDDGNCDNGQFCDGGETCDPVNDCQPGTPVDCNDMVTCTDDSCDEDIDECVNAPDDGNCDNGQFCDGGETCDPVNDCQPGTPVDCNDMVTCTDDSCNEETDECDNDANDANCEDGNVCTDDVCDPVDDCMNDFNADTCPGICRTAGFWGQRGGGENNYTQAVIVAGSGCLNVCGEDICGTDASSPADVGSLGSALEAECVRLNNSTSVLDQTYRQMVAAALNCVLTGAPDCGDVLDEFLVGVTWAECNAQCAGDRDEAILSACLQQIDCWNNGYEFVDNGACAGGVCSVTGDYCDGDFDACPPVDNECINYYCSLTGESCDDYNPCPPVNNECVPTNGCHDRGLCDSPIVDYLPTALDCYPDPEELGAATGGSACRNAQRNDCLLSSSEACNENPCIGICEQP